MFYFIVLRLYHFPLLRIYINEEYSGYKYLLIKNIIMMIEKIKVFELASKIKANSSIIIDIAKSLNIKVFSLKCELTTEECSVIEKEINKSNDIEKTFSENIKNLFQNMKDPADLLEILNQVNQYNFGKNTSPLKLKYLTYYAYHSKNRYKKFTLAKKSGGSRTIYAPKKSLKNILSSLNKTLHFIYKEHKSVHGFAKNKSVVSNAKGHVNKEYVFNIDLKDFFTNIHQARIWKKLQLEPFNLNGKKIEIANIISNLVCYQVEEVNNNFLPQGFPTSPILSNIICERLDRRLTGLSKRFNVYYSRYADDITFSSNHNVYTSNDGIETEFIGELKRIIEQERFEINIKKTRLQKKGYRQEVTGIIVNEKLNLSKSYIKKLRIEIYILEKFGVRKANEIFIAKHILKDKSKNYVIKHILGKLEYLKMVKGEEDSTYIKLKERFNKCVKSKNTNNLIVQNQIHNPKKLVEILSSFTKNNNDLKFVTHNWDMQTENERFSSIEDFLEKIKKEWNIVSQDLKILSPRLNAKINSFLFNKNLGKKNQEGILSFWGKYQILIGWSSPELKKWTDNGNSPFEYELGDTQLKIVENKTVSSFLDVIEVFKKEIEIRSAENQLKNFFSKKRRALGPDFNVKLEKLEGIDFYTDVQWFERAINHIFDEIKIRAQHPDITVVAKRNIKTKTIEIIISQTDSIPNKTVDEMKKEIEDGSFQEIYHSLFSLCDWSIESKFLDGNYRINYLNESNVITVSSLDNEPIGFTHILRFYK